jgi:hypothetical protein
VGKVLNTCDSVVYPAARLSDRVDFGTGPAILKGLSGSWESYPFFPEAFFEDLRTAYDLFPLLFDGPKATPWIPFWKTTSGQRISGRLSGKISGTVPSSSGPVTSGSMACGFANTWVFVEKQPPIPCRTRKS